MRKVRILGFAFIAFIFPMYSFADEVADIKEILTINSGLTRGNIPGSGEKCRLDVYGPNEKDGFSLISDFGHLGVYIAPYPNDGSIFNWAYSSKGTLTSYDREDKTLFTIIYFDLTTRKFQRVVRVSSLSSVVCEFYHVSLF